VAPHAGALTQRARSLLPASGSDLLTSLAQRIDLYLVGFLLGDAPAGVYGVLRQLRTPITQVRQSFDGILTPLIARTMRAAGDIVTGEATAAATRLILTIQLAIVLLMAAAGEPLLALFGPHYVVGYHALIVMVLAETVNGAFGVGN
jgi:O-antigen/teichoic acid export membrane protein